MAEASDEAAVLDRLDAEVQRLAATLENLRRGTRGTRRRDPLRVSIRKAIADGRIVIDPLVEGAIQPSSVDLRVDRYFRVFRNDTTPFIDPKQPQEDLTELVEVDEDGAFILHPGEFVLGSTLERVALPDDLVARLEGKSSLGRLGLLIHSTAGFVDAGWDGHLTLELSNVANLPIALYPGMKIGQISFLQMTTRGRAPVRRPTGPRSKYQGQRGPTPSRYYLNFRDSTEVVRTVRTVVHRCRHDLRARRDPTAVMGRRITTFVIDLLMISVIVSIAFRPDCDESDASMTGENGSASAARKSSSRAAKAV